MFSSKEFWCKLYSPMPKNHSHYSLLFFSYFSWSYWTHKWVPLLLHNWHSGFPWDMGLSHHPESFHFYTCRFSHSCFLVAFESSDTFWCLNHQNKKMRWTVTECRTRESHTIFKIITRKNYLSYDKNKQLFVGFSSTKGRATRTGSSKKRQ